MAKQERTKITVTVSIGAKRVHAPGGASSTFTKEISGIMGKAAGAKLYPSPKRDAILAGLVMGKKAAVLSHPFAEPEREKPKAEVENRRTQKG